MNGPKVEDAMRVRPSVSRGGTVLERFRFLTNRDSTDVQVKVEGSTRNRVNPASRFSSATGTLAISRNLAFSFSCIYVLPRGILEVSGGMSSFCKKDHWIVMASF